MAMEKRDLHNEVKKMKSLLETTSRLIWEHPEVGIISGNFLEAKVLRL